MAGKPGLTMEIEGIGDLDYGGIMLNAVDLLVKEVAEDIVMPEVKRRIDRITGETERSIKVKREGFFDPRGGSRSGVAPTYSVYSDPSEIEHAVFLEFGHGGKNSFMRKAARSRRVKSAIGALVKRKFGDHMRAQVRKMKRKRKKT